MLWFRLQGSGLSCNNLCFGLGFRAQGYHAIILNMIILGVCALEQVGKTGMQAALFCP